MFQISQFASGFDQEVLYLRLIGPLLAEMASLKPNILTTLLEDMKLYEKGPEDVRKPVLLQIRSIIPALEEGDLWPNRGFYLKVSDLSHAMYASLPHEHDDMILSNKLQLGQFIYVQKLEAAYPVPILRGVMPVPGRRPCDGTPEDIVPVTNLVKFLENSDVESVKDKGVILENKGLNRWASDSESLMERNIISDDCEENDNRPTGSVSVCDEIRGIKPELCSTEHETDSDSPTSSILSSLATLSKRRSWNETELLDVKKMFDSSVPKIATKPKPKLKPRSRSAGVSPIRNVKNDSSDDISISTPRRRSICSVSSAAANKVKTPTNSKAVTPKAKRQETPRSEANRRVISDKKASESRISWDSLPSNLATSGKEMIRDRDMAMHAAVEAMQEACAAEKLVKCISTYSEFQSLKGDDPQPFVDKFFDLQDDLSQARLVVQSLTNISPLRSSDSDINNTGTSVKEVLNLAVERKKNATSWVKSAIAYDLSPFPSSLRPPPGSPEASRTPKKPNSTPTRANKPKLTCVSSKPRKGGDVAVGVVTNDQDWVKGSALSGASELANMLHDESRRSFLAYVEKFLDEAEDKTSGVNSDCQITGMMYQIKRVHDWIDLVNKEAAGGKEGLGEAEIEACGRLKSKIYDVLLKHVERTAMALENMNAGGLK